MRKSCVACRAPSAPWRTQVVNKQKPRRVSAQHKAKAALRRSAMQCGASASTAAMLALRPNGRSNGFLRWQAVRMRCVSPAHDICSAWLHVRWDIRTVRSSALALRGKVEQRRSWTAWSCRRAVRPTAQAGPVHGHERPNAKTPRRARDGGLYAARSAGVLNSTQQYQTAVSVAYRTNSSATASCTRT
jgi:hypothetical protein